MTKRRLARTGAGRRRSDDVVSDTTSDLSTLAANESDSEQL